MDAQPSSVVRRAYSVKAFCHAFGVSRSTTYNLLAAGKLPDVRIAGRRVIPVDAAEALLRRQPA